MLDTTYDAIKAILRADPSVPMPERNLHLAHLREKPSAPKPEPPTPAAPRILRREIAAERLGRSRRAVDMLAQQGTPPPENEAKEVGKAEEKDFVAQLLADKTKEELRGLKQDIDERKIYAQKSFNLVAYWVSGVFLLLLLDGAFYSRFTTPESRPTD